MANSKSFRVGKVRADLRGSVWYLTYHENGRRVRSRVSSDRNVARQTAAQINAQLETGAPTSFSFNSITISELQRRWLEHHEHVRRSSIQTVRRYRTATSHLLEFVAEEYGTLKTSQFSSGNAERFVRYLRTLKVAPNGHPNTPKRSLLDNGVRYILETCRSMFMFAVKRRHLSPYAENPFSSLGLDRMLTLDARPIVIFSPEQERAFLMSCDNWQFPLFLTLMLTGMRPGELTHLLMPQDVDLENGLIKIRNKPRLGWQVKTRNERDVPLIRPLVAVLRVLIGERKTGPVFMRRRFHSGDEPLLLGCSAQKLEEELLRRVGEIASQKEGEVDRGSVHRQARGLWRDVGAIRTDRIRTEFMRVTKQIDLPEATAPKSLRHLFATCLQDSNVDPLIRCELMGHSTVGTGSGLGMTARYTHTRPETKRKHLEEALRNREAVRLALEWMQKRNSTRHNEGRTEP